MTFVVRLHLLPVFRLQGLAAFTAGQILMLQFLYLATMFLNTLDNEIHIQFFDNILEILGNFLQSHVSHVQ